LHFSVCNTYNDLSKTAFINTYDKWLYVRDCLIMFFSVKSHCEIRKNKEYYLSNSYFVKSHLVKSVDSDAAAASCLLFLFFWELSQCVVVHVYSPLPNGNKNWTLNLTFFNPTGQSFFFFELVILFCLFFVQIKALKKTDL